jgi:hypothetical protein
MIQLRTDAPLFKVGSCQLPLITGVCSAILVGLGGGCCGLPRKTTFTGVSGMLSPTFSAMLSCAFGLVLSLAICCSYVLYQCFFLNRFDAYPLCQWDLNSMNRGVAYATSLASVQDMFESRNWLLAEAVRVHARLRCDGILGTTNSFSISV